MKKDKIPETKLPGVEETPTNGNGKKEEKKKAPLLTRNMFETAFSHAQTTTALDILALPGKEILDLMMRTNFKSKRTDGHRQVRAMMRHIAKMKKFHCKIAEIEAMMVVAGDVSIDGEGRDQVVRAVTADFSTRGSVGHGGGGNISEWLQKTAQTGKFSKSNNGDGNGK